eukprot:SAG22_NODE_253_length_13622_cov_15.026471_6_plen_231_part_00
MGTFQDDGFDVMLSASNTGLQALGPGVYVSQEFDKAVRYAEGSTAPELPGSLAGMESMLDSEPDDRTLGGCVLELRANLGRVYQVDGQDAALRTKWAKHGYDSAYAPAGAIGKMSEICIHDARRIHVVRAVLSQEAINAGGRVVEGRLVPSAQYYAEQQEALGRVDKEMAAGTRLLVNGRESTYVGFERKWVGANVHRVLFVDNNQVEAVNLKHTTAWKAVGSQGPGNTF